MRLIALIIILLFPSPVQAQEVTWWPIQSVDTMKYSRDRARETINNPERYKQIVDEQVGRIAKLGATHVAIGTPYDKEFWPALNMWVESARRHHLNVWFRGNLSGWEGWFGYPRISALEHRYRMREFLEKNGHLFANNDIFTPCPECENGGEGDPRQTDKVDEFRQLILDEQEMGRSIMRKHKVVVTVGLDSMNGDVARLVMDPEMTVDTGGVVTIDHYTRAPQDVANFAQEIVNRSQGKVVLGEFGAPIPDIHGKMSEIEQAEWLRQALSDVARIKQVIGVNYWTADGSSTELFRDGVPKLAAEELARFYKPQVTKGKVVDHEGKAIEGVNISSPDRAVKSDSEGNYQLAVLELPTKITILADGYKEITQEVGQESKITLERTLPKWCYGSNNSYPFLTKIRQILLSLVC